MFVESESIIKFICLFTLKRL